MILDISKVASGQLVAQLINFISIPILVRLYKPEAFGFFAIFSSIVWITVVLATAQAEHLIITMKSRERAKALTYAIIAFAILVSILFQIVFLIVSFYWQDEIVFFRITDYLTLLLGISVFLIACNQALRYYATYTGQFINHSLSAVLNSIGVFSASISYAVFYSKSVTGLIIGQAFGFFLSIIPFLVNTDFLKVPNWKHFTLKIYSVMIFVSGKIPNLLITHLSKTLSNRIPLLIVAKIGGEVVTGMFAIAERLISSPTGIFGNVVGQVFRHRYKQKDTINPRKMIAATGLFSFCIYSFVFIFADYIVLIVLGDQWLDSVIYIRLFTVMEMFNFVFYCVEDAVMVKGVYQYRAYWYMAQLFMLFSFYVIAISIDLSFNAEIFVGFMCFIRILFVLYDLRKTSKLKYING